MIAVGFFVQCLEKQMADDLDIECMRPQLVIARLDDIAEDIDHLGIDLLAYVDLMLDQTDEMSLIGIDQQCIFHSALHDHGVKRAADIVRDAELICSGYGLCSVVGRDDDDGDLVCPAALMHDAQHLKAVHLRHIEIQQHKVDSLPAREYINRLLSA